MMNHVLLELAEKLQGLQVDAISLPDKRTRQCLLGLLDVVYRLTFIVESQSHVDA
jgi:hypothetical protein